MVQLLTWLHLCVDAFQCSKKYSSTKHATRVKVTPKKKKEKKRADLISRGLVRPSLGGWVTHLEDQNKKIIKKTLWKMRKKIENWGKFCSYLVHPGGGAGYGPADQWSALKNRLLPSLFVYFFFILGPIFRGKFKYPPVLPYGPVSELQNYLTLHLTKNKHWSWSYHLNNWIYHTYQNNSKNYI